MNLKDEIKFWQKAKKILIKGYGKTPNAHNGGISLDCVECRASIAVSVIEDHIDLLEWKPIKKKNT